jgi:C-terminal processing protease CtpA/Prc
MLPTTAKKFVCMAQAAKGGCLRNRHETYKAAEDMMASLGDQYSQFLPPSQASSPATSMCTMHEHQQTQSMILVSDAVD